MTGAPDPERGIARRLAQARARLNRLQPDQVGQRLAHGAVLIDIRPRQQRALYGDIPGALVVERNVLEWRLDPTSEAALPIASTDLEVILICQERYASSLAAEALLDLGIHHATDVIGGYTAWASATTHPARATDQFQPPKRQHTGW